MGMSVWDWKTVVSITAISNIAVTTCVPRIKKGANLFIKVSLNKVFNLRWDGKLITNYKNIWFFIDTIDQTRS